MAVTDPYRVLQVTPFAEQEVVNAAYRALALKYRTEIYQILGRMAGASAA